MRDPRPARRAILGLLLAGVVLLVAAVLLVLRGGGASDGIGPGPVEPSGDQREASERVAHSGPRLEPDEPVDSEPAAPARNVPENAPPAVEPAEEEAGAPMAEAAPEEEARSEPSRFVVKISSRQGGFEGDLDRGDLFGAAIAEMDDLDGDGVRELAVGAPGDDEAGENAGAVWVLFPDRFGAVRLEHRISAASPNVPPAVRGGHSLGYALAVVRDLNGDGRRELAVAQAFESDSVAEPVAMVWILCPDGDGAVVRCWSIAAVASWEREPGARVLSLASPVGPFSAGKPSANLAIGTPWDPRKDGRTGVASLMTLHGDGSVDHGIGCAPWDCGEDVDVQQYARAILLADVSGEGGLEPTFGFLADGFGAIGRDWDSVVGPPHLTHRLRFPVGQDPEDPGFGASIAWLDDRDDDGALELAVGMQQGRKPADRAEGGIWLLSIDRHDLAVKRWSLLGRREGGFPGKLRAGDRFGASLAHLADRNGDGLLDLAVGAPGDDDGGKEAGAVWLLGLDREGLVAGW